MEQDCPRIKKQGNTVILDLVEPRDFIIPMLAAIDFAIIPRSSIDPKTLKIVDYRNTTGPYYVEREESRGDIVLKANPYHFHYDPNMPQNVVLVSPAGIAKKDVVDRYKSGEINHITTFGTFSFDDLKKIALKSDSFYESIYIHTEVVYITEKGKKRLSLERRLAFVKSLQKAFHEHYGGKEGYRTTRQFFVASRGGQGFALESENLLRDVFGKVTMESSGEGIFLGMFKGENYGLKEYSRVAQKHMPNLRIERFRGIPFVTKLADEDMPDYILLCRDSSFLEDASLLFGMIDEGIFGLSPEEGKAWLNDYMNTRGKKERLRKVSQLHLKSLTEGWMIPLITTPYVAIARKPWKIHFSPLFASNPFWKIRRD